MTPSPSAPRGAECGACPLAPPVSAAQPNRRDFLRLAGVAAASLGLVAAGARDLLAMTPALQPHPADSVSERRYSVPASDGVVIDRDGSAIIARAAGHLYAFALSCPHQNTALRWESGDGEFRCPKHKSRYRSDGTFIDGRATRSMDRLPIRRDGGQLVVDIDVAIRQDEEPQRWASAFVVL
ncbi:MAG: Rieske [2Fe-2S] iron-sulfur protein [Gemmatimonadetes bacterium]|nr:Rieske [2Fe-2S] iron-sulfur protein [Gemmatimonadota bacterium]